MNKIKVDENFKRGLYSVTAFALCIVTLLSFWIANRNNDDFLSENTETASQKEITTEKDVKVNTPVTNIPDDRHEEITTETPVTASIEFAFPLKNTVLKGFSKDELVKNVTTGDWRTHGGIDI